MILFRTILELILILPYYPTASNSDDEERLIDFYQERTSLLPWTAGHNFPPDTKVKYVRNLVLVSGYTGHFPRNARFIIGPRHEVSSIPSRFDAREKWPHCRSIKTIRDQGQCASCWAVAVAATMSDRTCIASGGRIQIEYSAEDIMTCCEDCLNQMHDPCKGGSPIDAFNHWTLKGFVSGGAYGSEKGCKPYPRSAFMYKKLSGCRKHCTNTKYPIPYERDKHYSRGVYVVKNNTKQIQAEIMINGPVQTHYIVYKDFFFYQYGVYVHSWGETIGKHCVKLIGWGTENETPYWLVANTWGRNFGQLGGFFKILRGENHCEIETMILTGYGRATQYSAEVNKSAKVPAGVHRQTSNSALLLWCGILLLFNSFLYMT